MTMPMTTQDQIKPRLIPLTARSKSFAIAVALFLSHLVHAETQVNQPNLLKAQVTEWVRQGEALRDSGSLLAAQNLFDQALKNPENQDNASYAAALTASGYNQFLLNKTDLAEQQLKEAYQKSAQTSPYLHALSSEYLGSLYLSQGADDLALRYFNEAYRQAKTSGHPELEASIALLKSAIEDTDFSSLAGQIDALPEGNTKARLQLQWAEQILDFDLSDASAAEKSNWIANAYHAITAAQRAAELDQNTRFQAEAATALARLYYQQERFDDALSLADKGIALASESGAGELAVRLNKLKGDCLKQQGNTAAALQAYTLAVETLSTLINDIPINLPNGQSSVDVLIDPVYRAYVDLLLQPAKSTVSGQNQVLTAVQSMEAIKILNAMKSMEAVNKADLQDFLLSRCTVAFDESVDWTKQSFPGAVVLYPIIFNDRVELILKSGETVYHRTVNVTADELNQQVEALTFALQNGKNYKPAAMQLYQWLIAPIRADLQRLKTETLVYVPDRSIRGMPLAALFDGQHFVVEELPVVTLPSLELKNLYRSKSTKKLGQTLIAGISKPDGPSVDKLPKSIANNLARINEEVETDINSESNRQKDRSKLVEALSLPGVEKEMAEISSIRKTQPLLNQKFTADVFKSDLESAQYSNVHIASHGYFGKNIKDSFIMAYDQNLTLKDFEGSLSTKKLKQNPLDLLALSACETAEGNDRMLLGFSGLAVNSNALSAVGSLWSINDAAALQFMKTFYAGLNQSLSKAQAMQQAQVAMIKSKKFHHPYYWSPFILTGNWQ